MIDLPSMPSSLNLTHRLGDIAALEEQVFVHLSGTGREDGVEHVSVEAGAGGLDDHAPSFHPLLELPREVWGVLAAPTASRYLVLKSCDRFVQATYLLPKEELASRYGLG